MKRNSSFASRRAFLKGTLGCGSAFVTGGACGGGLPPQPPESSLPPKSRVVIARDASLRSGGAAPDSKRVLALLDRAMQSYYGCDSYSEAWRLVTRPGGVIGLKVNCLAGKGMSTSRVLVDAICERLQQVGARDIVIWDRLNSDLESAGFRIVQSRSGQRCYGNDTAGYEQELEVFGSVGSLLSTTLTRTCDAIINLPLLKDHGITGMTGALKNLFGAIHNPNKYHLHGGNPYVADVNMIESIRRKVRLTIIDAMTGQYEGGPSFMPQWTWPHDGLLVGSDPVALDYTAWQIIEKKRAQMGRKSLREEGREPLYIATAADGHHRLGNNNPARIELVET